MHAKANKRQPGTPLEIKVERKMKLEEFSGILENIRNLEQGCVEPYDESV